MNRIRLTQYDSELEMEVDPSIIIAITQLSASHGRLGNENGLRTRIDSKGGLIWMVKESLDEISDKIAAVQAETVKVIAAEVSNVEAEQPAPVATDGR